MTGPDPIGIVEAENPRDEVVESRVKIEEVADNGNDDESLRSEVSRASLSLEQEVRRSGRTMC